jgi:hypothetical protein
MDTLPIEAPVDPASAGSLINILGVVYAHVKTTDGGDLYLTQFGLPHVDLLAIDNWYEKQWFEQHRERLEGTSAVYRVFTKTVAGRSLELVVKTCRVGEDVPLDTHTLAEFVNAEFNSPWEEFALVMEMREGKYGPPDMTIHTQEPLAIYVPPEKLQIWQTGRSRTKINKINARHPGIDLDILRQYILIYSWISGNNAIEALQSIGIPGAEIPAALLPFTMRAIADLEKKGFVVADMKPAHIIIDEQNMRQLHEQQPDGCQERRINFLASCINDGHYSIIDYELLLRTENYERQVKYSRRHSYLDDMRDRFVATPLPSYLQAVEIFGVPYIHGHVESTGGQLWVVGRNARLFDYFLPERWRKTPCQRLSPNNEVYYTITKDNIHIVWKTSRVGEKPAIDPDASLPADPTDYGYNSPFEEIALAHFLNSNGVPTIYLRAIYMTGSEKLEQSSDRRRYESHQRLWDSDGKPILREDHNYITIRGYYNGPDSWVAKQEGQLDKPVNLLAAQEEGLLPPGEYDRLMGTTQRRLREIGCDGSLLKGNDLLLIITPQGEIIKDAAGNPEARICNVELIRKA